MNLDVYFGILGIFLTGLLMSNICDLFCRMLLKILFFIGNLSNNSLTCFPIQFENLAWFYILQQHINSALHCPYCKNNLKMYLYQNLKISKHLSLTTANLGRNQQIKKYMQECIILGQTHWFTHIQKTQRVKLSRFNVKRSIPLTRHNDWSAKIDTINDLSIDNNRKSIICQPNYLTICLTETVALPRS